MDDLITFLRARESEREAMAQRLIAEHGPDRPFECVTWTSGDPLTFQQSAAVLTDETGEWARRSFFYPKDVLADVEMKRQIIEFATDGRENGLKHANGLVEGEYDDDMQLPEQLLRLLALPYAGHSAFKEEWRV